MSTLTPGTRLGPYQIVEPVGAGGMGEVYKAIDTRLERTVAIKLLPLHWADNSEMRQRFEREAQIVASLNHPNICVIHDIGRQDNLDFLVMEYLEGGTLGERLQQGPIPWQDALKIAIAMADALDKAHRHGVIHRDLKPANIILTSSGPKLLDFGLAKWQTPQTPASGSGSASSVATLTDVTLPGVILGTLQYMAPEQLEGLDTDARTDIFAFGAVLHEMISGRKTFEGKSRVLLMSAIATAEPRPLIQAQPEVPAALEHIVRTCLEKEPADRWQTTRDLLAELQWVAETGGETAALVPAPVSRSGLGRWRKLIPALALLPAAALAWPAYRYFASPDGGREFRFRVPPATSARPDDYVFSVTFVHNQSDFALSPDGRTLAYIARPGFNDRWSMYIRPLNSVTPQKLTGTEFATLPFWSADGTSIGYHENGKIMRIPASGGPPQQICAAPSFQGGAWNREGVVLFGSQTGIYRVSAEGGKPELVKGITEGETGLYWPHFLPDGRRYLYTAWNTDSARRTVYLGTVDSPDRKRVVAAESNAAFSEPGYVVFQRANAVYAQRFDPGKGAVSGEPVRLADDISYSPGNGLGSFSAAAGGVLAFFQVTNADSNTSSSSSQSSEWQLAWVDRGGGLLENPGPSGVWRGLERSPDEKRIAVHRHENQGGDIWVIEPRGSVTRLTFDASRHNCSPIWSPDGSRIAYSSQKNGKWGLYQTLSSGSGTEELLFESESPKAPMSWSPDGKRIVFWVQDPKTGSDLWVLTLDGARKAEPLIATPAQERHGQISPDGRWIAYASNSTGRSEIYVQPFPTGSGRWQISVEGAAWPRWRKDTKEITFHALAITPEAPAANGAFIGALYTAEVTARGESLESGNPKQFVRIPALNFPHDGGDYHTYDLSKDAQRILMVQLVTNSGGGSGSEGLGPDATAGMIVARNWPASLRK